MGEPQRQFPVTFPAPEGRRSFYLPQAQVLPRPGHNQSRSCSSAPFFLSLNFPWWVGWEVEGAVSRWELPSQEP